MRIALLAATVCAFTGWAHAAHAEGCDPAVMHFWKADGLADTRVGSHKEADMCFDAADSNSDGSVDRDEWGNFFDSLFDSVDSDGDGTISDDEIDRAQSRE